MILDTIKAINARKLETGQKSNESQFLEVPFLTFLVTQKKLQK